MSAIRRRLGRGRHSVHHAVACGSWLVGWCFEPSQPHRVISGLAPAGRHRGGSVLLFATRYPAAWGLSCRAPSKQTAFSRVSHQHCLQLPQYSLAKAAITVTKITKCTRFPISPKMTGSTQNMSRSMRSSVEICAIYGCSYDQRKLRNFLPMQ